MEPCQKIIYQVIINTYEWLSGELLNVSLAINVAHFNKPRGYAEILKVIDSETNEVLWPEWYPYEYLQ